MDVGSPRGAQRPPSSLAGHLGARGVPAAEPLRGTRAPSSGWRRLRSASVLQISSHQGAHRVADLREAQGPRYSRAGDDRRRGHGPCRGGNSLGREALSGCHRVRETRWASTAQAGTRQVGRRVWPSDPRYGRSTDRPHQGVRCRAEQACQCRPGGTVDDTGHVIYRRTTCGGACRRDRATAFWSILHRRRRWKRWGR